MSIRSLRTLAPKVPHIFTSRSPSPYFNLAVENHLLTYAHSAAHVLFTYTNAPCVVIGRNQNPWVECDIAAIKKGTTDGRNVELIRRRSGGGSVFHDEGNLNYTVIVPGEGFERKTHVQMVVDALEWMRDKYYYTKRWKEVKATERNDIVASLLERFRAEGSEEEWFKVSGTAFKLTRGRALHHGTLLHSSPYIDFIGSFLRSPGKSCITAKGVESVRSPVMNLWGIQSTKKRRDLAWTLRKTIQQKWVGKYAIEAVGEVQPIEVADSGVEESILEIKAGIEELQTDAWRWEQTPGFSFDSKDVEFDGGSVSLAFEVKNGVIHSVKTSAELQSKYEETVAGKKIIDISETGRWREALTDESLPEPALEGLVSLLEKCFPPVKGEVWAKEPATNIEDHQMELEIFERTDREEDTIEVQSQGSNTLVEVQARDKSYRVSLFSPEQSDNSCPKTIGRSARRRLARLAEQASLAPPRSDTYLLRRLGSSARRLTKRLARWTGQASRLGLSNLKPLQITTDHHARSLRYAKYSYAQIFRDLTADTVRINVEMLRLRDDIARMMTGQHHKVFGWIDLHQNLADEVDQVSAQIRGVNIDLTRFLTILLAEQAKETVRAAARTSIRPDPVRSFNDEVQASDNVDPEGLSNSQRILQATLRMMNEEDTRWMDVNDSGT